MNCDKCGKEIGVVKEEEAYQVRVGFVGLVPTYDGLGSYKEEFHPKSNIGHYCSGCLAEGV